MGKTVFRPYSESESLRSDRSAGDRVRHRHKVRQAIRENIADIIAEESIIGRSRDKIIKVPIRGIKEYRFVYGENLPGVATGDGKTQPGQVLDEGEARQTGEPGAGDRPGVDYYETDVTLEELVDIMFEDLELPDMERKHLREVPVESARRRKGFRKVGIRAHLDKKRTAMARVRRKVAQGETVDAGAEAERFPFHRDDMKYRRLIYDVRYQSNAVVICIMDTSGSMDTIKKYLARSFFFLLYQFVRTRYNNVEVVFVAHDVAAREVDEDEFFSKGESGGTMVSSGYAKALEVIQERYHPTLWNIYAFHCSDGDNWEMDNPKALKLVRELCKVCNLFGYGEIKPLRSGIFGRSLLEVFEGIRASNFQALVIEDRVDVWPGFRTLLSRERVDTETAAG